MFHDSSAIDRSQFRSIVLFQDLLKLNASVHNDFAELGLLNYLSNVIFHFLPADFGIRKLAGHIFILFRSNKMLNVFASLQMAHKIVRQVQYGLVILLGSAHRFHFAFLHGP